MSADLDVVVIGAGAAGLAAAHELRARGREVLVLEANDRPGGVMQAGTKEGFTFDRGPNTFRLTGPARALLETAGVLDAVVKASPESRARFLLGPDGLEAVPLGPLDLVTTRLISGKAKRRMLREPFVAKGDGGADSVAGFISRRLGDEAVEKLVGPFLVGVYAGDARKLGAEPVFPALVRYERQGGSIVAGALRAALARSSGPKGRPGSYSGVGGVGALAQRLAAALGEAAVRCSTPVEALEPCDDGWSVHITGEGDTLSARAVVVAVEAPAAAALLGPLASDAAPICRSIAYAPVASVSLDVDPSAASRPLEGFGFLVPASAGVRLLGGLFMSRLFPGRAPAGRELVTAMIGGLRWPEALDRDDAGLIAAVHEGLDRALGTGDTPRPIAIARWPRAIAQPGPDHVSRIRGLRRSLSDLPPLALAGGWLDGVALSGALESGLNAASALPER